ncbi:hypothetical protein LY90DRAFT_698353 [Neocallimastix californiae]|jgi:hypothetical protein|uniref:Phosphoglycerate mutase-like protein n=1 Tax=Neocallimastix californiae TaxID=1754190 RepID=A0A1Y2F4R3_9FUNG|nr:hypothetical protein LY90DRAFT_698353 [Neocallimastix californiae]|eukprot:ORY78326.1 hypothetical protein LY90DRAFT_698353 [Neocallimastix californiae]
MRLGKFIIDTLFGLVMTNAKTIMLIRHGEKIDDDHTDLSPIGESRANCLTESFGKNGTFVTPQKIFAQSLVGKKSTRPRDTVVPLATSLGLEVDLTYESDDVDGLIAGINGTSEDVVLVCWSNDNLKKIAKKYGIKDVPSWGSNVFNEVWIITDGSGKYLEDNSLTPIRTQEGESGYKMVVIDENAEKCIQRKFPSYSQANGAGNLKVGFLTFASIIGTFLYFLY